MAAKFRKVDPRIWTDERFRKLTAEGRLLALWLLTSTRLNRCGIVMWSPGLASEETGIPHNRIDTVCDTVCHTLTWSRDPVSNTVFLRRWWRYNQPDNEKALKGALSDLHDVPAHSLKSALLEAMQDLPSKWHTVYRTALDTVCHTVCHTVSSQEQEKEQEKKQEKDSSRSPETLSDWTWPVVGDQRNPEWQISTALYETLIASYPAVNVDDELRKSVSWAVANPRNRKTASGMPKFLNAWMARQQNGHGTARSLFDTTDPRGTTATMNAYLEERASA